jgi:WD40 repeat protein
MAWHPSEPRLAYADDRMVHIVDLRRPGSRLTIGPAPASIRDLVWASKAPLLATSSTVLQIWSTKDGALKQQVAVQAGSAMSLSHDGRFIAIADGARAWRVADGVALPAIEDPPIMDLWALTFVADNRHLAALNPAGVLVWDITTGKPAHQKMFATGAASPLAVSPDGAFVAVAEELHRLLAYRLSTATTTHLETVSDCADHLVAVHFAKDSRTLRVGALSGWWRSWNLPTLSPRSSYKPQSPDEESWMSDDGATVIVRRPDGTVEAWDAFKSRKRHQLDGRLPGMDLELSSDGRYLSAAGEQLAVWDLNDGRRLEL